MTRKFRQKLPLATQKIDGDFETFEYAKINIKCFLLNDAKHYKLQINTCDVSFNRIEYLK